MIPLLSILVALASLNFCLFRRRRHRTVEDEECPKIFEQEPTYYWHEEKNDSQPVQIQRVETVRCGCIIGADGAGKQPSRTLQAWEYF